MRFLLALGLGLVAGCSVLPWGTRIDAVGQSPDWWRSVATADQIDRIERAEADKKWLLAEADSMRQKPTLLPLDYGFFLTESQLTDPGIAFAELMNTQVFASSFVSVGGEPSAQYIAFNALLNRRGAAKTFRRLRHHADMPGQLYALCGIYLTDRDHFNEIVSEYQVSADSVWTFWGDIARPLPVAIIVENPRAIRLDENETIAEWFERRGRNASTVEPAELVPYDIVGGAWPQDLVRRD